VCRLRGRLLPTAACDRGLLPSSLEHNPHAASCLHLGTERAEVAFSDVYAVFA